MASAQAFRPFTVGDWVLLEAKFTDPANSDAAGIWQFRHQVLQSGTVKFQFFGETPGQEVGVRKRGVLEVDDKF